MSYYFSKKINATFDEAIEKVTAELQKDGFGILTEIDVKATLKKKLDVDFQKYKILGACNPNFAHQAIDMEPQLGTLLPCNVLIYENEDGGVVVSAMDPEAAFQLVGNPSVDGIAKEVKERIAKAMETL